MFTANSLFITVILILQIIFAPSLKVQLQHCRDICTIRMNSNLLLSSVALESLRTNADLLNLPELMENYIESEAPTFPISNYLTLSLLKYDEVEAISDIVVDSNYKSILPKEHSDKYFFDRIKIEILKKLDSARRNNLKEKVREGFIARAYNRLLHPTLSLTEESIIIILRDTKQSNNIIGVIEVYPTEEPYLCNLAVSPLYRRQGYGRVLCMFCEILVSQIWGKRALTLHVDKCNLAARRLYESMNYTLSDSFSLNNLRVPDNSKNLVYYRKKLDIMTLSS